MNDREFRLRLRIDRLTDERDKALADVTRLRRLLREWRTRAQRAQQRYELWRLRAERARTKR